MSTDRRNPASNLAGRYQIRKIYLNESDMMIAFQKKEIDIAYFEVGNLSAYSQRSDIFYNEFESNVIEFLVLPQGKNQGALNSPISRGRFSERRLLNIFAGIRKKAHGEWKGEPERNFQHGCRAEKLTVQVPLPLWNQQAFKYRKIKTFSLIPETESSTR